MEKLKLLKAERVKFGLNQSDMARILGCSVPAYNQKENGKRSFSQNEISIIADTLHLSGENLKNIFFAKQLNANNNT